MKKEMTCISCPIGCAMTAEIQPDGTVTVSGNQCARGLHYATEELVDPRRVVTATCRTVSIDSPPTFRAHGGTVPSGKDP